VQGLEGRVSRKDAKTQRVTPSLAGEALALTLSPPGRGWGEVHSYGCSGVVTEAFRSPHGPGLPPVTPGLRGRLPSV